MEPRLILQPSDFYVYHILLCCIIIEFLTQTRIIISIVDVLLSSLSYILSYTMYILHNVPEI